jgi:hypothetical protein
MMSRRFDGLSLTNCPTENQHTHDLPLLWQPAHRMARLSIITTRWSRTNIALQRGAFAKKSQTKSAEENFCSIHFRLAG